MNIYAPCVFDERIDLWDSLSMVISQFVSSCICIIGDFNSIRRLIVNNCDLSVFDSFIQDNNLFDFPLHGRSYTYYRTDGSCKSRIGRVLAHNTW